MMSPRRALLGAHLLALAAAGMLACAQLAGFERVSVAAPDGGDAGDGGDVSDAGPVVLRCIWQWAPTSPGAGLLPAGITVTGDHAVWVGGTYGGQPQLAPKYGPLLAAAGPGASNSFLVRLDHHSGHVKWDQGWGAVDGGAHPLGAVAGEGDHVWVGGQTPAGTAVIAGDPSCAGAAQSPTGVAGYLAWFGLSGACGGTRTADDATLEMVSDDQSQLWELGRTSAGMSLHARYLSPAMDRSRAIDAAGVTPHALAARDGDVLIGGAFTGALPSTGAPPQDTLTSTPNAYDAFVLAYHYDQNAITPLWAHRYPSALSASIGPSSAGAVGVAAATEPDAGLAVFVAAPFPGGVQGLPGSISTQADRAILLERLDGATGSLLAIAAPFAAQVGDVQRVSALRADLATGQLVLAGNFQGTIETTAGKIHSALGYDQGFLAVLDPGLGVRGVQTFDATSGGIQIIDAFVDAGFVLVVGIYSGSPSIDARCGPLPTAKGSIFAARLDLP